jgi:hypothetical protein
MAAALLRRSVATAGLAVLATVASPLVGTALAASAPALTAGTFSPADGDTVTANRPPISVAYNTALNLSTSTITLTDATAPKSPAPACPRVFSSDKTKIGCTPQADLVDGHDYKVAVHAENADSSSKRDDNATWTLDIPSVTARSLPDNSTVGVLTSLNETFDEEISPSSTVDVVDGHGNHLLGNVSVGKSSATGDCPLNPCILKYSTSSAAGLGAGTYTATFKGIGVSNSNPSGSTANPDAYGLDVIHFTVVKTPPPHKPDSVQAPANGITQANVAKVPFHGWAVPGFNVGVAIYDEVADSAGNCATARQREGFGCQDGFGFTSVDQSNCANSDPDKAPKTVDGVQLCYFELTVDDSAGCDTDSSGNPLCIEWPGAVKNQWYAFSYSGPGNAPGAQNPAGPSPATDPEISRDTSGPQSPSDANAHVDSDRNTDTAILTWTAHDGNNDGAVGYRVTATDPEGHSISQDFPFPTGGLPDPTNAETATMNISGIDDGAISVNVAAYDTVGNASGPVAATLTPPTPNPPPAPPTTYTLTKESRLVAPVSPAPDTDTIVAGGNTISFPSLNSGVHVPTPTKITVYFNEPIKLFAQDTTQPTGSVKTAVSWICLNDGSCVNNPGVGTYALTADKRGLVWSLPASFTSTLADAVYSVTAIGVAATCQDKTPANPSPPACEVSSDPGPTLTSFHIDTHGPAVAITSVTNPVTPRNVHAVQIAGTTDAEATGVQVVLKSSGGGAPLVLSSPLTPPSDPMVTSRTWSFFPVDLSQMRDGTVTVTATAVDAAQNKGTSAPVTTSLRAHVSRLTETVSSSRITFGKGVLISGRLVDQVGAAIRGATISVRPRFDGGRFGAGQTARTDSTGRWHLTEFPAHNSTWYAAYAGSTTSPLHDAAVAHTARTLVRVAIAFTSPRNHATVGSPVVLKGKVAPNKRGSTVSIYRHTSHGNKLLGRVRLDRHSHWSFKLTLRRGTVKLFAVIGRTTGNLGNRTRYLTLTH